MINFLSVLVLIVKRNRRADMIYLIKRIVNTRRNCVIGPWKSFVYVHVFTCMANPISWPDNSWQTHEGWHCNSHKTRITSIPWNILYILFLLKVSNTFFKIDQQTWLEERKKKQKIDHVTTSIVIIPFYCYSTYSQQFKFK